MDPVSHAVFGRAIIAALDTRLPRSRGTGAAAMLGALSPDVDLILVPFGWDIYLRVHAIGTHAVIGSLVMGLLTAVLLRVLVRSSRYGALAWAASIGGLSHLALDVFSGAPLQLLWPLLQTRFPLPLVAMADPWLFSLFMIGALALMTGRQTRARARVLLGIVMLFLAAKGVLLQSALNEARTGTERLRVTARVVQASWGSLTDWYLFDRTPDAVRQWRSTAVSGPVTLLVASPLRPESTLITASRTLDTVSNFLHVHELGFAKEESDGADSSVVLWSDIRFCSAATTGKDPITCQFWFGGLFGPDGRVIRQEVRVGGWVQDRPPRP